VTDALNVCRTTVLKAAELLWAQDRTMAWAYYLQRAGAWMTVRTPPPVSSPDSPKTGIPVPPAVVRRSVEDAFSRSRWADVLSEGEPLAGKYIYWLDLHRMVSVALDGLGPSYAEANAAVRSQVRGFVERFPAIPRLAFADGTPLASDETQTWIASLAGSAGAGESAAAAAEREAAAESDAAVAAAREALQGGRVGEGVGLLLAVSRRASQGRDGFEKLLLAARMAVEGKKPALARPLLEDLLQRIDDHQLETWQPELCVAVYTTVLEALRASKPAAADKPPRETEAGILEKICRLDPALAVRLGM
jgi:type VI secretion system protein VasJ